jgi:hypothetical protein
MEPQKTMSLLNFKPHLSCMLLTIILITGFCRGQSQPDACSPSLKSSLNDNNDVKKMQNKIVALQKTVDGQKEIIADLEKQFAAFKQNTFGNNSQPEIPKEKSLVAASPSKEEFKVTPAMLTKAFAGKARLQDGKLTLTYTFRNEQELNDFQVDGHAIIQNGTLTVRGDTKVTHKVVFDSNVAMSCEIGLGNRGGEHFRTTDGIWVKGHHFNVWWLGIGVDDKELGVEQFNPSQSDGPSDINTFFPLKFMAEDKHIQVCFGSVELAGQTYKPFQGQLQFCGGSSRDSFRNLTIRGYMDKNWAKDFFKPFASKNILDANIAQADLNNGLVAYYQFKGNSNDTSGNNNNGVTHGATATCDRNGTPNSAYYFNGINNYVQIPSSPSLDIRGSVSLCAWVKNNSDDDGQIIWRGDGRPGTDPYQLHISHRQMYFEVDRGDGLLGYYNPSTDIVDNAWHFWVGVFDETTSKSYLYKDNVLQNIINVRKPIQYDTSQIWNMIGAVDAGTWQFFCGSIDDVRIYNRALTHAEVTALRMRR